MMNLTKKQLYKIILVIVIISIIVGKIFERNSHGFLGFSAVLGFCGGWLLIIVSKMIMMPLLQKKENYYDEDADGGDDNDE